MPEDLERPKVAATFGGIVLQAAQKRHFEKAAGEQGLNQVAEAPSASKVTMPGLASGGRNVEIPNDNIEQPVIHGQLASSAVDSQSVQTVSPEQAAQATPVTNGEAPQDAFATVPQRMSIPNSNPAR